MTVFRGLAFKGLNILKGVAKTVQLKLRQNEKQEKKKKAKRP